MHLVFFVNIVIFFSTMQQGNKNNVLKNTIKKLPFFSLENPLVITFLLIVLKMYILRNKLSSENQHWLYLFSPTYRLQYRIKVLRVPKDEVLKVWVCNYPGLPRISFKNVCVWIICYNLCQLGIFAIVWYFV